ncbi:MAG: T9SS type A sorting domain-containing protein, partial [Chitinophagaceae bacterium]
GGADDGFNLINKTALPLNATSNYAGGADDGSTALLVSAVALVATSMNSGGPNDGVGSVSTSLMSLTQPSSMYTGGGNDGYSTASMNISLVALSIVWEDFSVRYNRADALLEWNVGNERQDDGFEIQRSYDGYNFSQIGFVKSKTSFGVTNTYQYTDPNPAQHCSNGNCSNVYYRLRQIDLSGKFSYSPIKRLSLNYNAVTASVYPNPASDKIIVQLNAGHNAMAGYYIALRNSIGATVYKSEMLMMPLHELDVRSYASGTYYLQLFIDGRSYPYQITITH